MVASFQNTIKWAAMHYVSTRRSSTSTRRYTFEEMLQTGYCKEDGGILLPETLPEVRNRFPQWATLSYPQLATEVMKLFCPDDDVEGIPHVVLSNLLRDAYDKFGSAEVVPIVPLGEGVNVAELYHGPTHAFKDLSLQPLGRLLEYILTRQRKRAICIMSTTGDTGPAAIAALQGKPSISCVVLFPLYPAISMVQQMQMIAVRGPNVRNIGTSILADENDEAMRRVFEDAAFRESHQLTTINSINMGRILFALVHYFWCYLRVNPGSDEIVFAVPSGSFGNATAGWLARQMGLPARLLVVNNRNDVTHRLLTTGVFRPANVEASLAPAIDCQTPYNYDRIFYGLVNVQDTMKELAAHKEVSLPQSALEKLRAFFTSDSCSDEQIQSAMQDCWRRYRYIIDPHTAVGLHGAQRFHAKHPSTRVVVLSTAHAMKFVDTVKSTIGVQPLLPHGLRFLQGIDLGAIRLSDWNVTVCHGKSVDAVTATLRQTIEEMDK